MGSKNRIAKELLPILLKDRKPNQWYVEPFAGGMNMIDKVDGNRLANDSNEYLIKMWIALVEDEWIPNSYVSKDKYLSVKNNKQSYEPCVVGWIGFNCSYSGKYFGGFAGVVETKQGQRNYQEEAHRNIKKQIPNLTGVEFVSCNYINLHIPDQSIIYCDPPYEGTTKYKDDFNHLEFWNWVREKSKEGHTVFVSEYNAPDDFICVWQKELKSSLSANGTIGGSKKSIEKLFTLRK